MDEQDGPDSAEPPHGRRVTGARHASGRGADFGYVVRWTVLGALVPGSGLVASGRRRPGFAVLVLLGLALTSAAVFVAVHGGPGAVVLDLKSWVLVPDKLDRLVVGLPAAAGVWALVLLASHVALRRRARLHRWQRGLASLVCLAMAVAVCAPAAKGVQYALITKDVLTSVFAAPVASVRTPGAARPPVRQVAHEDPWAERPRVNVLLMGSDAGEDREGLRPDSLILASIDTRSGDTVLFSLPRNLQGVPFPDGSPMHRAYPNGFRCYETRHGQRIPACLLNAVWTYGEANRHLFDDDPNPGLTATEDAVEGITGLRPDHYVMLNLKGFQQFVDAIDGVEVTVRKRLPIGGTGEDPSRSDYHVATGGWIEKGRQRLDGRHALWFARSRWSTDDYDRMRRQRCVIAAAAHQADPMRLVRNFPAVAAAVKGNLATDIPLADLQAWADLALKVRSSGVRSLAFTNQVIDTSDPDVDEVHRLVRRALRPPRPSASPTVTSSLPPGAPVGPSAGLPTSSEPSPSRHGRRTTSTRVRDAETAARADEVC